MSERKEGWYWVKTGVGWECAKWERGHWYIVCAAFAYDDKDWQEIGPRIPTPDEPWQTVPVEPTREMIDAAMYRAGNCDVPRGREEWRAMGEVIRFAIESAPTPGGGDER